jgi:hypothetical protein
LYCQIVGRSTRTVPGIIEGLSEASDRLRAIQDSQKPKAFILDPLWLSADHDLCTPSFLIAPDQELAGEMNKVAGKSYSLRQLSRQIQEEKEAAILRRLEGVARFREGRLPADYFAAATQAHAIVNYEPVYVWESNPPTRFSCLLLEKAGIDPASVSSEGAAREILREIGKRRYKKLAEIRALAAAADAGIADLWSLTAEQARKVA